MSRHENRNRREKQQKKNGNKHALTSLAPPTEQIAIPAVILWNIPAVLTSYFFLAASFHAKCSRSDFGTSFALCIPEELWKVLLWKEKERKSVLFCLFCFFFAAAKSETVIVRRRCRVSVLLFRSDVYVMSLPFSIVVFFGRFSVPCPGFCLPWW